MKRMIQNDPFSAFMLKKLTISTAAQSEKNISQRERVRNDNAMMLNALAWLRLNCANPKGLFFNILLLILILEV